MSILKDLVNTVKKYCDDDVCLMILFILVGLGSCYLFKDQISGFSNFASFGDEGGSGLGSGSGPSHMNMPDHDSGIKNEPVVGVQLKPRKPEPTPSTKRALEVMSQKAPVERKMIHQKNGLLVQDSMVFKPFDEVWNPGFMPLDMVFKNVNKSNTNIMGQPMGPDRPMGPSPMAQPSGSGSPMAQPSGSGSPGGNSVNLVLIYAPWCGHSKRMLPDYERLKSEFDGKNINGKNINISMYTDEDKDKVKEYGVKGFPSLFIEKDGNRESFPHRTYEKMSNYLNSL
jgi:thiol-disulfide isomerase/thioredoxin